jgi:hypothetical protein
MRLSPDRTKGFIAVWKTLRHPNPSFLANCLSAEARAVRNDLVSRCYPSCLNLHRGIAKQHVRHSHIAVGDM